MLYLVGLGLGDARDITMKGLEVVKGAFKVYLEAYTSILSVDKGALEEFYGREVILAYRENVEAEESVILDEAKCNDVVLLVVGDPLGATTHSSILLQAHRERVKYKVIHNASIMNAVGSCGLQLYSFGETVSIVLWSGTWQPESFVDKIEKNLLHGLHTLCLLDIKVKEQTIENMMKGNKIYEPPRYMTVAEAAQQLLAVIERRRTASDPLVKLCSDTLCVGLARIGTDSECILARSLKEMAKVDLGPPLHSLVVVGPTHSVEDEMLTLFSTDT